MYRPPNGDLSAFFEFLERVFQFVGDKDFRLIISGDFNIIMYCTSARQVEFSALLWFLWLFNGFYGSMVLASYGFFNMITIFTRVTPLSETLLYLFIPNITRARGGCCMF